MAVEASRSSGSVDSYIGSLITLTSKSEIRYEGILYQINVDEASIGLRNVRSFGTEGRRKDGPQVPPIDKIYEYIVFRGSDIKDLQVKSSPPVQSSPSIHNDPAIIQSHHSQAPSTTRLPLVNNVPAPDLSVQMPQTGFPRIPFQSNLPLYQPGGTLSSWGGPSSATPPAANSSGPTMSLYWQGYYGPPGTLQGQQQQQQNLLQPPQTLSIPPSTQQSVPKSSIHPPVPSSVSQSPDPQPTLLQPLGSGNLNVLSTMLSGQSPAITSESPASFLPSKSHVEAPPPSVSQIPNLPLVSPLPHALEKNATGVMPNQAQLVSSPMKTSYNSVPEKFTAAIGTSSSSPPLVTPGQFLQPGPTTTFPSSQPLQNAQKDVEVVPVSSSSLPMPDPVMSTPASASASASTLIPASMESQAPLLPLPSPSNPKLSNSAINYAEDFDFEAMNEKFKKDQVWGHLGKSKAKDEDEDSQYKDGIEFPRVEIKSVYNKDDFFDTLSCNSLDGGSRNGRPRFSEQMRLDTETFGNFPRYRGGRGGRGGRGSGRGGRLRGGYYGRGYGYVGRGRGGYGAYRAA